MDLKTQNMGLAQALHEFSSQKFSLNGNILSDKIDDFLRELFSQRNQSKSKEQTNNFDPFEPTNTGAKIAEE